MFPAQRLFSDSVEQKSVFELGTPSRARKELVILGRHEHVHMHVFITLLRGHIFLHIIQINTLGWWIMMITHVRIQCVLLGKLAGKYFDTWILVSGGWYYSAVCTIKGSVYRFHCKYWLNGGGGIRLIVGFQPLMIISPTASWIQWCMQVYACELMWTCLVWAERSTPDSL